MVEKIANAIKIPLTCKIRILNNEKETLEIAKLIEKAGAKAITIHGRTAKQKYSGKAEWNIIKKVKEKAKIPIILNGDVKDEISAEKAFSFTKCDAVMIGRAAIGNPFIFKRISYYLGTGKNLERQTYKERINDFEEFLGLCKNYSYINLTYIKMQACNFAKEFIGASRVRDKISKAKSAEEIINLLNEKN